MEKISLRGWLDPRRRKLKGTSSKREIVNSIWQREISSSARLADEESREDFVFENGKERKRNPRKERSRRKCLIHSMEVHGKDKESTSLCHFWRRRVPMWIFLTGFDDESREDFWVWTEGGQTFHGSKMERKGSGIPGRKQSGMPFLEIRRRVPMWIFLTGFDEESRESLSLDGRRINLS